MNIGRFAGEIAIQTHTNRCSFGFFYCRWHKQLEMKPLQSLNGIATGTNKNAIAHTCRVWSGEQETIKHLCLVQWDNCWSPVGPKIVLSFFLSIVKRGNVCEAPKIITSIRIYSPRCVLTHMPTVCRLFSLFWTRIRFPMKCKHLRNCLIFFDRKRWSTSNSIASWNRDNGKTNRMRQLLPILFGFRCCCVTLSFSMEIEQLIWFISSMRNRHVLREHPSNLNHFASVQTAFNDASRV